VTIREEVLHDFDGLRKMVEQTIPNDSAIKLLAVNIFIFYFFLNNY